MSQYCFLIPIYNHDKTITATVERLLPYELPIIIVDDGSNDHTKEVLATLAEEHKSLVLLHTLPENSGKGGAVMAGFHVAAEEGFTHALQIDSDGQHDSNDIPEFLALSKQNPGALISGYPQYDESMPTSRRIGRKITHFWVHIETLSMQIKDTMCGFRVYPLYQTVGLIKRRHIGTRMDFDIEIMVRLYWAGTPVLFIPTKVIYPQGGQSHFRALQDNLKISWLHTRLFFGMLPRIPLILLRRFKS
ncbi:glycosyltransferase family 2 protein [Idiomarina loihiensis]|mgnify:FL=1|uniref:Glycosyltransferase n=1 Tax=Idiomarina loihiensis (strain ATCC BAA-735 / DSM 15497 / L2-TR) TaxID=283942 RepID=Q5QXE7_IDILO|nr:glycosyltransferase family 2 protein [Idiomarina loihiensis]AAV80975.1 Glycosyltransferase [Idiomarina loihiensis L2TR]AGM34999.1 glycosyltransferase [Idiomarina loihiensis GSL 199]